MVSLTLSVALSCFSSTCPVVFWANALAAVAMTATIITINLDMFISWFLIDFGGKITVINPPRCTRTAYQVLT